MPNPILEKSLDEIIGENKPAKKFPNGPKKSNSRINKPVCTEPNSPREKR